MLDDDGFLMARRCENRSPRGDGSARATSEDFGGLGRGYIELRAIAEELVRACAPIPFASTVYFVAEALQLYGSDAQKTDGCLQSRRAT